MRGGWRLLVGLILLGFTAAASPVAAGEPMPLVEGSWQKLRQAHAGRPTIIHFWGLTCGPCRTEMPEWGKFAAALHEADLITIHAEHLPPNPELVREMLRESGLENAENWEFSVHVIERLRREIDPKWQGELPITWLISRDGTSEVFFGPADLNIVRQWLAKQQ
jgi:thiol-disulfide isomerase/thioredoxin